MQAAAEVRRDRPRSPHIYHQVGRLLELGAEYKGYYARDSAVPLDGFVRRFPDLPRVRNVRALLEDLRFDMSDEEFDRALGAAIDDIYRASTVKG